MNDPIDAYIRQGLKNWGAQQKPPPSIRAQLLLHASAEAARKDQLDSQDAMDESLASPDAVLNPRPLSGRQVSQPRWVFMYMTLSPLSLTAY